MHKYAGYATRQSMGREHAESIDFNWNDFQLDNNRIILSNAFRRLAYKTQVFVNYKGDLFRSRLTHSLEVAQLGVIVARALHLNDDLLQTICLAHDLGHSPFGHVGQDALNKSIKAVGGRGFEHNLHGIRIVDHLEEGYLPFDGINLTFETKEGMLKHCSIAQAKELGKLGERFLLKTSPSLEAQVADIVDELAYICHDIDDGLLAQLISLEQLEQIDLIAQQLIMVKNKFPQARGRVLDKILVRQLTHALLTDLIEHTAYNIQQSHVMNVNDVRLSPVLVGYSKQMQQDKNVLRHFLLHNLWRHKDLLESSVEATNIIQLLFDMYMDNPILLPVQYQKYLQQDVALWQIVSDYIAGMTDRYAYKQYKKIVK